MILELGEKLDSILDEAVSVAGQGWDYALLIEVEPLPLLSDHPYFE